MVIIKKGTVTDIFETRINFNLCAPVLFLIKLKTLKIKTTKIKYIEYFIAKTKSSNAAPTTVTGINEKYIAGTPM